MTSKRRICFAVLLATAAVIGAQDVAVSAESSEWKNPDAVSEETAREEAVREEAVREEAVREEAVREEAVRKQTAPYADRGSEAGAAADNGDSRAVSPRKAQGSVPGKSADKSDVQTAPPEEQGSAVQHFMDEFMATSADIGARPGGKDAVSSPGPPGKPNWFQVLMVTRDENLLLEKECRQAAAQSAIDDLGQMKGLEGDREKLHAAAEHMHTAHGEFIRGDQISYSRYLKEVAECKAFCGPLVANLLQCHILSVARRPHGIILFERNSAEVDPRYYDNEGVIATVERELRENPDSRVLVIGRASRIGDLRYNRRLSGQRALAAKDLLVARGVPEERIRTQWFGWEPPQISTDVAYEYGMKDLFEREGPLRMNQSVMLVVY